MHIKVKRSNELINMRKKRTLKKRSLLFILLLIALLCTICLKLAYFNISKIDILSNKNVSSDIIVKLSGIEKGNNIFYINIKKVKSALSSNPYILDVIIKRKLPNTIILTIKERDAMFFVVKDNKYVVMDNNTIILEMRDSIDKMDLIKVDGVNIDQVKIGDSIIKSEDRKVMILNKLANLANRNTSGIKINRIDLTNLSWIQLNALDMNIKIGNEYDMERKLNKALNIISSVDAKGKKGYIDVSSEGNPVFFIEK